MGVTDSTPRTTERPLAERAPASHQDPFQMQHRSAGFGLPITWLRFPGEFAAQDVFVPDMKLTMILSGHGRRRLTVGRRSFGEDVAPRMIGAVESGYEIRRSVYQGEPGKLVSIHFPRESLNAVVRDYGRPFRLQTVLSAIDDKMARLVTEIWRVSSDPADLLYVDGLTLALVGLLRQRFGREDPRAVVGTLNRAARQRLVDLIEKKLGEPLSVARLADEVGLSPQHFTRVFGRTFEQSPHNYVIARRIEAALRALSDDKDRPLSDIAMALGFSNPAHFSRCFKARVGVTPSEWRRR